MSVPYDYDQTNVEHLRAVIAEQEQTIEHLHERCKAEEAKNAELRKLAADMWPSYCYANSGYETFLTDEQDVAIRERACKLGVEVD